MKPRHANALLVVGWYLLVSFSRWDGSRWIEPSYKSFSDWKQVAVYDSATQCQTAKNRYYDSAIAKDAKRMRDTRHGQASYNADRSALTPNYLCAASDDPRLAK